MPGKRTYLADLEALLPRALAGDPGPLEAFLVEHSNLPGPRGNLELAHAFADTAASLAGRPDASGDELAALLDRWAAVTLDDAPPNAPREMLPFCAALGYGAVAAARPDWWEGELAKLRRAAADGRWRTREMAATGLQRMLGADWPRACNSLVGWASDPNPLVVRAAVAAVAEPALLTDRSRAEDAVSVQAEAVRAFSRISTAHRRDDGVRALRKALGYTLSVVAAAAPDAGFPLLEELAALPDTDSAWIVRENLKKKRLQPFADRLAGLEAVVSRPG